MRTFSGMAAILLLLLFSAAPRTVFAQSPSPPVPSEWQTVAERTGYRKTPRYAETGEYARRLDRASGDIRYQSFGKSGENRDLPLVIAATNRTFTPATARKAGKVLILIQACIHAGECDGKDAGLALLRDIAVTKTRPGLLQNVVVLFVPIYNADGHERFGPFNRVNQNGPERAGFRANAANLNLNRDYMKADAPETRAFLRLWNEWKPDLFIDCHVTDGADYRYNLTYDFARHGEIAAPVQAWQKRAIENGVLPAVERAGNRLAPYILLRDNGDPQKGMDGFLPSPRFSTGYAALHNRPGILIETHSLKNYRSRVRATYDFLWKTLDEVNQRPQSLLHAVRAADAETIARGKIYDAARQFPVLLALTGKERPFPFKGVAFRLESSDVSGTPRVVYDETEARDETIPFFDAARVAVAVAPPLAYLVPPQWTEVIDRLRAHGLLAKTLRVPVTIEVESYRLTNPKWAATPFEGRVTLGAFASAPVRERRTFPAGSLLIPLDQPGANVAVHLLEPASPDSLLSWGFFNAIFEQKEYGEAYVMEKVAREMLAKDANLKQEFGDKIKADPAFAASPAARLNFFWERSPYFDQEVGRYPVGRIISRANLPKKQ